MIKIPLDQSFGRKKGLFVLNLFNFLVKGIFIWCKHFKIEKYFREGELTSIIFIVR